MAEDKSEQDVEVGRSKRVAPYLVGVLKHLGIPTGIATVMIYACIAFFESKQEEWQIHKNEIQLLREDVKVLKSKMETDAAQWRLMQRINQDVADTKITTKANELILDKILGEMLTQKSTSKGGLNLTEFLGFNKEKKPKIVIQRAPNREKSNQQFQQEQVQDYRQEQLQQQIPMGK